MSRSPVAGLDAELTWFKSSHSDSSNPSDCVEVANTVHVVLVRDSKHVPGAPLRFPPTTWADFVSYAALG